MKKKYRIGLDFGTSYSFPAVVYGDNPQSLIPSNINHGIPSVFYHDSKFGDLYGAKAQNYGMRRPDCMVTSIKQKLDAKAFSLDGKSYSPKQIAAQIIEHVLSEANKTLEINFMADHVAEAVIAVPITFGDAERAMIKEAAELSPNYGGAGIKVLELIPEPVAAAIDYFGLSNVEGKILVYDLGGGTFDVALVEKDTTGAFPYKVVDQDGKKRLGGDDWDQALFEYLAKRFENEWGVNVLGNKRAEQLLLHEARGAKERLSGENVTEVELQVNGEFFTVDLNRSQFEQVSKNLLDETLAIVKKLANKNKLIGEKNLHVILVGGSSYMPQVKDGIVSIFGANTDIRLHRPEMAIAYGAALFANGIKAQLLSSFTYGVDTYKNDVLLIHNLIKKGSKLPFSVKSEYVTRFENQESVLFRVYEHRNDEDYTEVSKGREIMQVEIEFGKEVPKGTPVDAQMMLNESGLLELTVIDKKTGKSEKNSINIQRV